MRNLKKKTISTILVGAMALFMAFMFCACSTDESGESETPKVDGVAATVNGEEITEQEVTDYIEQYRTYTDNTDDAAFATFLEESGLTPETLRNNVIQMFIEQKVVEAKAAELGIEVTDDELNEVLDQYKSAYGYADDDEGWAEYIKEMGYADEEAFNDERKFSILEQKLVEQEVPSPTPTEDQLIAEINSDPDSYTGRKSYNIVFQVDDTTDEAAMEEARKAAQDAIDQLMEDGTVTEEEIDELGQKLVDEGTAGQASDVGWDCQTSFVTEYQDALDGLSAGQLTQEPVESTYGYHVILCTGVFEPAADGSVVLSDMPDELYSALESTVTSSLLSSDQSDYIVDLIQAAEVVINDAPEGLPYFVDMSLSTYGDEDENANVEDTESSASDESTNVEPTDDTATATTSTDGTVTVTADGDESTAVVGVDEDGTTTVETVNESDAGTETEAE